MSISTEISRIQSDRNTIRAKLVELGMATNLDNLDALATAIGSIINQGAVTVSVQEGETYTIPKGYHNGSGTVSGVSGGGNYSLQSKTATPTKKQQNITPDSGYYGLSDVTINPIPDAYQDVTSVTATSDDVLTGKVYVTSDGTVTTGTMTNNGTVTKTLNVTTVTYTIPKGYHSGSGKVTITLESKTATPTESSQDIIPTDGKVLSKVTVNPIPITHSDTSTANALQSQVLDGQSFIGLNSDRTEGTRKVVETGTMPNRGAISKILDTDTTSYTVPEGYHNGSGVVKIVTETKTATPTKSSQTISSTTGKVLSSVTVNPIPASYQNVTGVTTIAENVLAGKVFVNSAGEEVEGTMPNIGAENAVLDTTTTSHTISKGYHSGEGVISITLETKTATPTKSSQTISPSTNKVLSSVTVNPIPDAYQDVTGVTATAAEVLSGSKFVNSSGTVVTGTMPNNGTINAEITGMSDISMSVTIPAGYTTGGTVSLTSDIETALAAI